MSSLMYKRYLEYNELYLICIPLPLLEDPLLIGIIRRHAKRSYMGNARVAYWHMYGGELSRVHSGFININTFFYVQHFISQYFFCLSSIILLACRRVMLPKLLLKSRAML